MTVGPTYKRPDVNPTPQFRSQLGATEAQSLADLPWWGVFKDPALQALITQAIAENYDLRAAVSRIDQARAQVGVSQADLYPQIGYSADASRQKTFFPFQQLGGNVTYNAFGLALSAIWELDLWGRVRRATEAARANLYTQEDIRRGVMLTLVADVASGYFNLIELDRQLAIAQESSQTYKRTLDLFTQRYQSGRDSRLGVVRAQAAYDSSLATVSALNRTIAQQENAISVLLGAYPQGIKRGVPLTEQVMPQTPVGETTEIIHRRPDVLQAEHTMVGANAEIGVAVANFFPRIGIGALFGTQAPKVDDLFDKNFMVWQAAANVSGPLFQGGRLTSAYHAQQAFWDETIAEYKKTVVGAFREVSDALIAQQTLVTQRTALEDQVKSLRESVDLALARYQDGRSSYFEVLQAEQELFPSEDALAQTQEGQLVAVVNLYKALGGGWNLKDADWEKPQ
jgi:multidrug efflux system outer membrane protein